MGLLEAKMDPSDLSRNYSSSRTLPCGQRFSRQNARGCSHILRKSLILEINVQNCAKNMAKKRSASAKEKLGKTPSVSRSCVSSKPNGVSQRSSRSPPKTTTRSTKRDLKSTRVPSAKESPANRRGCKEERTKRGPCSGKRRHSSHEEPNESLSKKPKIESLQVQKEETTHSQTKDCSLQGNRKKVGKSEQLPRKGQNRETITTQTNLKQALTVEENYSKQKSPLKNIYEATPENLQGSPGKDKVVGKRLKLDLVTNVGEDMAAKNDAEGSSCDESSDEESVAWEDVDEAHVADHRLEIADHETEASASHQQPSPSKKIVEISLTVPGAKKKKGWNQEDFMKYVKRAINRFRKEVFINVHKVHLLALVAHGMFRNSVCNDPLLQAVLLSHVPNDFVSGNKRKWDVAQLTNFLKWFQSEFTSTDDGRTGETEADKQVAKLQNLTEVFIIIIRTLGFLTRLVYSLQPMSAKGDLHGKSSPKSSNKKTLQGTKPAVKKSSSKESSKTSTLPKKQRTAEKKEIKTENEVTQPSSTCKSVSSRSGNKSGSGKQNEGQVEKCLKKNSRKTSKGNCTVKASKRKSQVDRVSVEDMEDASSGKKNTCKTKTRPLRKRKRVDYSLSGSNNESDADKEWNDQSSDSEESSDENRLPKENSKLKEKTPLTRRKKSTASDSSSPSGNSSLSFVDLMDDDSDFEVTSKPLVRRQASAGSSEGKRKVVKIVSSDESDESVKCLGYVSNEQGVNWWAEVYLPVDKKWICVHLESSSINHPDLCEKQATQPLVYVVAFDNKNSIKDVTNRYASSWMSKTRKLRIDSDWWEDTLRPYKSKNKKMMEMEDSHLEDQLLDKPLPTSITEYKNHPLYVLKRHLLKFEAIYPETAAILGYCRNEAVYSRECVHTLHTREKWLNEALVVKQGEKAYKVVKGRPKRNQPIHERDSVTIDLFGRWQTEKYKPPPAKDGKVPRNEYGNVELFLPCMLPPGTKHIQINGIHRVAKKLGIDCAQAVVGFDFHGGFSHPVIDGVVVCEEFEQALLDAWKEEEEQAAKRKAEKREKRMLANWRLLTRSLLIRERLKKRYDTEETNVAETSNDGEDEMITGTSICWPLNRQEGKSSVASDGHCHVFPESGHKQDSVTGEWTKSCSCGLTLPFEKM